MHESAFEAPAARWARFSRYVIRDGYIRPAPGAEFSTYSPGEMYRQATQPDAFEAPHRALLRLRQDLDLRSLTPPPKDEASIVKWCERYGLLGLLLQEVEMAVMAPRWSTPPGIHAHGAAQALVNPVARHFTRGVRGWTERSTIWAVFPRDRIDDGQLVSASDRAPEQWRTQGWDQPWVLRRSADGDLVKESLLPAWARFFPDVPEAQRETYPYPSPGGPDFWKLYAEPVEDFLRATAMLYEILESFKSPIARKQLRRRPADTNAGATQSAQAAHQAMAKLDHLFSSIHPCLHFTPDGSPQMQWHSASLMGAIAMMAIQDVLAGNRLVVCANHTCNNLFLAASYQARFCADRCRYAVQKRTYRDRIKAQVEAGPSRRLRKKAAPQSSGSRSRAPKHTK
ncbi:MAG: hypothetical protein ABIR79_01770 [Candidatus Binatia bacterium]